MKCQSVRAIMDFCEAVVVGNQFVSMATNRKVVCDWFLSKDCSKNARTGLSGCVVGVIGQLIFGPRGHLARSTPGGQKPVDSFTK